MTTKKLVLIATLLAFFSLTSQALARMTIYGEEINGEQPEIYERFYEPEEGDPAKAFIGDGYDWSGVGLSWRGSGDEWKTRWVTMISPQYFLTAKHAYPALGADVAFHEGNSLDSPSHVYTIGDIVASFGDLCIGQLTTPIDPADNIAYYPIVNFDQTKVNYRGLSFIAYGHGGTHPSPAPTDEYYKPVVGRNQIDAFVNKTVPPSTTYCMEYNYDTPPNGLGDDECLLELGDSGAPSFVAFGDKLAVVGIHWYTEDDPDLSGDSFVPHYINSIVSYVPDAETIAPIDGDANLDGIVDVSDLGALSANYGTSGQYGVYLWDKGDFNRDASIDATDLGILAASYGNTADWYDSPALGAVPEPSVLMMVVLGSIALSCCRRRR